MWKLHNFINTAYRDLIHNNLRGQEHVVTRRKVEKLYKDYLNTAAAFYKGYFQRLQVLHGMPQIPRINRILELESPEADSKDQSAQVRAAVQHSFYATLIHLGDINRWRYKLRPRPQGLKMAALYYELAIELDPRSGGAHHQLGVLDQDNHLQVVYRFYRSIAVEAPHPHGIVNLEAEFKRLSQDNTSVRRHGPPDPTEAFSAWFTKLHARFYKGERFPQELEEEVLHGLAKTLKLPNALPLLLKMVIINIAAYHVAKLKIEKEWSREASDSCQFILKFNIQWILVLSRTLQSELQEYIKAASPEQGINAENTDDAGRASRAQPLSIFTETVLPLVRLYVAWLVVYRTDLVQFEDHLGPHVFDMHRDLAQSLTTIAGHFNQELSASPYLLDEDAESLGLKPFDDSNLHEVCRIHHVPGKSSFKPHWEDSSCPRMTSEQQTMSRVHDFLRCGFVLALDDRYPLNLDSSGGTIKISYMEGTKVPFAAQDPRLGKTDIPLASGLANYSARSNDSHKDYTSPRASALGEGEPMTDVGTSKRASVRSPILHATLHDHNRDNKPKASEPSDSDLDVGLENRMQDMVDHLMDDDNSVDDLGQTGDGTQDFSHATPHTVSKHCPGGAVANGQGPGMLFDVTSPHNLWGSFQGLGLSVAKPSKIPDTPWRGSSSLDRPAETAHLSPLQPSVGCFTPGVRPASGSGLEGSSLLSLGNAGVYGAHIGHDGLGRPTPSPGLSGSSGRHSRQNLDGSNGSIGMSPYLSAFSGYATSDEKAKSVSPPLNLGFGPSSFSTTFTSNASGLPPVNSPFAMALPMHKDQALDYRTYSAPTSNNTQYQQYLQPGHTHMVNNGNPYDGTTAFNRGLAATRDDSGHLRNALKGATMEAAVRNADAYDTAILQSARSGPRFSRQMMEQ